MSSKLALGFQLSLVATALTFAPLFAQDTTAPTNDTRAVAREPDTRRSPDWGWLGLIGLAGLGGLARRDRDRTVGDRSAVRQTSPRPA
jgi:MYXO-CTERM domain-containing protein